MFALKCSGKACFAQDATIAVVKMSSARWRFQPLQIMVVATFRLRSSALTLSLRLPASGKVKTQPRLSFLRLREAFLLFWIKREFPQKEEPFLKFA